MTDILMPALSPTMEEGRPVEMAGQGRRQGRAWARSSPRSRPTRRPWKSKPCDDGEIAGDSRARRRPRAVKVNTPISRA